VIAFRSLLRLNRRTAGGAIIRIRILRGIVLALLLLGSFNLCSARDLALIVNKSNSVHTLTSADLGKLASGSLTSWPAGGKVAFILRDPESPAMKIALEKLFAAPADKIKAVIAANPAYFVVVRSDSEVIRMVESLSGAVGLIDIYSITSGVKVLKVNGKLPLEAGYALHGN
jgi:ABC-type phosphate transport system substrate-binding protein